MKNNKWTRWERTRSKGRERFLWVNGVIGFGVTTAVAWSICMSAFFFGWEMLWLTLPIALLGYSIGGYFWGKIMWAKMETAYKNDATTEDAG